MADTVIDAEPGPAEPMVIGVPLLVVYILIGLAFFLLT